MDRQQRRLLDFKKEGNKMKFTLIAEHETGEKITSEFENDFLHNVLDNIDLFLRGAGFVPAGTLAYTDEETYEFSGAESFEFEPDLDLTGMDNNMSTTIDGVQHAPNYWDTGRNR